MSHLKYFNHPCPTSIACVIFDRVHWIFGRTSVLRMDLIHHIAWVRSVFLEPAKFEPTTLRSWSKRAANSAIVTLSSNLLVALPGKLYIFEDLRKQCSTPWKNMKSLKKTQTFCLWNKLLILLSFLTNNYFVALFCLLNIGESGSRL